MKMERSAGAGAEKEVISAVVALHPAPG